MKRNQTLGALGEQFATDHLEGLGWHILDRNWRCRRGEIDIIARDGDSVVFVEVKTRNTLRAGHPLEHVSYFKMRTLRGLAIAWLSAQPEWVPEFRVDVIGIVWNSGQPVLTHVRNAQ